MKRLLSLLIIASMLIPACIFVSEAEDFDENQYVSSELNYFISDYYYFAEMQNGYFSEGDSTHGKAIVYYLSSYYPLVFSEYIMPDYSDDEYQVYSVPAEVYEEFVSLFFDISDPDLLEEVRLYGFHFIEPGKYRLYSPNQYGLDKEPKYVSTLYGYKDLGNGLYETYSYLIKYDQSEKYVPSEGETENVNYIVTPLARVGSFSITNTGYILNYDVNVGYMSAKIYGAVKSVIQYDESGIPKFLSFEKINSGAVSETEGLTIADIPFPTAEDNYMLSMMLGAFVNLGEEYYDNTSKVTVTTYTEYSTIYKNIRTQIKEKVDCNDLYVYDVKYRVNGDTVELDEPTDVFLAYPDTFVFEPTVYFIDEAGELVEVECIVDDIFYVATVEDTQLGRYVIADVDPDSKVTRGDITGEGSINLIDMYKLKCYINGSQELTGKQYKAADVNRDGSVNVSDAFAMKALFLNRD